METARANLTRAAIVAEALTWLDTPFAHQQRKKGVGVDCIGVPAETGRAFGIPECSDVPFAYTRQPNRKEMQRELEARLDYVAYRNVTIGDLAWILAPGPQHLGMVVECERDADGMVLRMMIIHASMREKKVVRGRLDSDARKRVFAWFRYRGLDG